MNQELRVLQMIASMFVCCSQLVFLVASLNITKLEYMWQICNIVSCVVKTCSYNQLSLLCLSKRTWHTSWRPKTGYCFHLHASHNGYRNPISAIAPVIARCKGALIHPAAPWRAGSLWEACLYRNRRLSEAACTRRAPPWPPRLNWTRTRYSISSRVRQVRLVESVFGRTKNRPYASHTIST